MSNDPKHTKIDLNKLRAVPEDPTTGEPQDKKPLYYRSKAKYILMDDGTTAEDAINSKSSGDHTHTADEIITDKDHQFISQDQLDFLSQGARYNKDIPTYVEHGGIPIGTTFDNKTVQEMFDMILYPYVSPIVSTSVITPGNGGLYEIGQLVTVTKIRVSITIKSNNITKITITNGNDEIISKTDGVENGGTFDIDVNVPVTKNTTFTAKVQDDTLAITAKNTGTFTFVYPMYYGSVSIDGAPTDANIRALTKIINTKGTKTFSFTANNQRMLFAYPKSYGKLSKIFDQNNFDVTDTFTVYEVEVNCLDLNQVDYYVYISERTSVSNFSNKFQW